MSKLLRKLIESSGKKQIVTFQDKDKRVSLDDTFGKNKIQLVSKIIGSDDNFNKLNNKLKSI
ncbi:hypothetical protein M9Q43_13905 [Flavobacterium sp. HXWNR29]|uniref:hypothetical protein n=1 Tax=Flavobacterium odoriferum TaxID=2946604 RepID=UPI0021CB4345|nr:hypothetical protein [Flavobacterium sp. HXWNR29]MCU4190254.1 hypothetical protein [Flavobacterium sp. HXWNR29]